MQTKNIGALVCQTKYPWQQGVLYYMVKTAIYTYVQLYTNTNLTENYIYPTIKRGLNNIIPLRRGHNIWISVLTATFIEVSLVEKNCIEIT